MFSRIIFLLFGLYQKAVPGITKNCIVCLKPSVNMQPSVLRYNFNEKKISGFKPATARCTFCLLKWGKLQYYCAYV